MANKLASVVQSGNNQYLTPALSFNRLVTDTVTPGVIGAITNTTGVAPMTGAYAVNAQGSPNMTVAVTGGVLYAGATPTGSAAQVYGVTQDVSENVTIASNATGSTRYDFIYMNLDAAKLNNPASNGLDVCTLVTSRSTTPYNAATAGSFGNSNGTQANTLLLAVVTVVNGAVSIGNSSITDARARALDSLPTSTNLLTNPYKFFAYRNAALNSANADIVFDTELYDTGSNYNNATGVFTAPVAGFYVFSTAVATSYASTGKYQGINLWKNGASYISVGLVTTFNTVFPEGFTLTTPPMQLAAGDTVTVRPLDQGGDAFVVGTAPMATFFGGHLVSTL